MCMYTAGTPLQASLLIPVFLSPASLLSLFFPILSFFFFFFLFFLGIEDHERNRAPPEGEPVSSLCPTILVCPMILAEKEINNAVKLKKINP